MKKLRIILGSLAIALIANSYLLLRKHLSYLWIIIPAFLLINLFAGRSYVQTSTKRLKRCCHGGILLVIFQISTFCSAIHHLLWLPSVFLAGCWWSYFWSILLCVCVEAAVFWNGMICIYLASTQLGIKHRVIGALCGMIPIVNLVVLNKMLRIVFAEVRFETKKEHLDASRAAQQICKTKYPILFVHGVFFRDSYFFNYWGRIPNALENNGAKIYYGNHPSAASIADCAEFLTKRIRQIVEETGCEKLNIIAHSKGGLDCRYAIANLGAAPYVASLTTINTPHRGCEFADFLLSKAPTSLKEQVANAYNTTLDKLGEKDADFLAAVNDLTASACIPRDQQMGVPEEIFCQSIGSKMDKASGGKFPLNYSYHLVKYFDGPNDGLVSEQSFAWGEQYKLLTPQTNRGISHGDMIDLNRENIDGFDVREFYVQLVSDLKDKGL